MMYFSDEVVLVSESFRKDSLNQQISVETNRKVFCDINSVSSTEMSEAGKRGLNPQYKLLIFAEEYNGEKIAEINGKRYAVYRTYHQSENQIVELYVEKQSGV